MNNRPIISHDAAARALEDALRMRVGRGKRYSFPSLSDATGIPTRTLESYVQGATPGLNTLLCICASLGPSFTSDILAMCGQSAADDHGESPEHLRALGALGQAVAVISDAVSDGHVDHLEAAAIRPVAAELIELLTPLARAKS